MDLSYSLYESSKNYLQTTNHSYTFEEFNGHYFLHKTHFQQPTINKIVKIVSFLLVIPVLIALFINYIGENALTYQLLKKREISHSFSDEPYMMIPTKDCQDTHKKRLEMIKEAEKNIIISGSYCGGKAFDELLNTIEGRMKQAPNLITVIIAHPEFIPRKQHGRLRQFATKFSQRFSFIGSPNTGLGAKNATNHVKATSIDDGRICMLGGSGIKDSYCNKGKFTFSDQSVALKKPRIKDDLHMQAKKGKATDNYAIDDIRLVPGAHLLGSSKDQLGSISWIEALLPPSFRDQDFIFFPSSNNRTNHTGEEIHRELLYLAYKWDQYNKDKQLSSISWNLQELDLRSPIFQKFPSLSAEEPSRPVTIHDDDNALYRCLKTPIPLDKTFNTPMFTFSIEREIIPDVRMRGFYTGPEDNESKWEQALHEKIVNATNRIALNVMYFHPTNRIMKGLTAAANRGVKITIITATGGKFSSKSERFFGHRNLLNLKTLVSGVAQNHRKNLSLHSFAQGRNGLHKKICVVDNTVLSGNSNFGTKSLVLTGDHEINFEAESEQFANKALELIEKDKKLSKELKKINLTFTSYVLAWLHEYGANRWG